MGLIKKPNELQVKKTLSALIYGQPSMGKTTLALSAPHPLLLDFDGGVHRVNAAHRVDTVQITKWEEVDEVMQSPEIADYATFVIDTAGKMLSFMDKYIMQNKSEGKHQDQINQQEQTAAVFRTEIWEAPYISHTHGASGCGKNEADRAGKTTSFFFHF